MSTTERIETLKAWVAEAGPGDIVFFGGAGVSTESGIPDFRGSTGLFKQRYAYPAEVIVSHSFFEQHPEDFYEFYCGRMIFPDAKPNAAHVALAQLEAQGKLRAVITQNIDGLHQAAGSQNVFELHGTVHENFCRQCGATFDRDQLVARWNNSADGVPRCDCGGLIKPNVVLYEEALDDDVMAGAVAAIAQAKLMIVAGTSLNVYPAAGLLDFFSGRTVIINLDPTPRDKQADLCIAEKVGTVLGSL